MKWKIYYGDGTTYSGESEEEALQAPTLNVQLIKQEADNPRGYSLRHGCAFFCWERVMLSDGTILDQGRWGGKHDTFGLMDYWGFHKGPQKVLVGREIHDDTYQEISRRVTEDGCLCAEPCDHVR